MANEQNLKPFTSDQSHDEAVKNGSKGGVASGAARREKRDFRRALEMLLEREFTDKQGNTLSGVEAISAKMFEQAMKGNIRAFETIRDTVGQKPVEKVIVADVEPSVIDEVEKAVLNDTSASD